MTGDKIDGPPPTSMNRFRLIRGLRIGWSVWWGILCVLLIVMWVRSNWRLDSLDAGSPGKEMFVIVSTRSGIGFAFTPDYTALWKANQRRFESNSINDSLGLFPPAKFSYDSSDIQTVIGVPYWFLAIALMTLAAAPWFLRNFSLRTLLIATTLIAVVLATAAYLRLW
jgi:hypothetical protein